MMTDGAIPYLLYIRKSEFKSIHMKIKDSGFEAEFFTYRSLQFCAINETQHHPNAEMLIPWPQGCTDMACFAKVSQTLVFSSGLTVTKSYQARITELAYVCTLLT